MRNFPSKQTEFSAVTLDMTGLHGVSALPSIGVEMPERGMVPLRWVYDIAGRRGWAECRCLRSRSRSGGRSLPVVDRGLLAGPGGALTQRDAYWSGGGALPGGCRGGKPGGDVIGYLAAVVFAHQHVSVA